MTDRFHVQKPVNKALNKIRLQIELKGLKNRYLLMSDYRDLNAQEEQELAQLFHHLAWQLLMNGRRN